MRLLLFRVLRGSLLPDLYILKILNGVVDINDIMYILYTVYAVQTLTFVFTYFEKNIDGLKNL